MQQVFIMYHIYKNLHQHVLNKTTLKNYKDDFFSESKYYVLTIRRIIKRICPIQIITQWLCLILCFSVSRTDYQDLLD